MPARIIKVKSEGNGTHLESPRDAYVLSLNDPTANTERGFPSNYIRTTKYTLLTFIPKNLFEQFRRISNFYFLIIVIVQLIPQITPLVPVTSILPLVFVLAVTALKEAVEDFYRHKADKASNTQKFKAIRDNKLQEIESQQIKAGDIVYIEKNQPFPADLILLSSSNNDGVCYVETANLDGETNLKQRKALDILSGTRDVADLSNLRGAIQCEPPNERLYQFNGRLIVVMDKDKSVYSLSNAQFLHRSAKLRNTNYIYGFVVYCGEDTKVFLNQQPPPSKFSVVERLLNKFILGVFIFQMLVCLFSATLSGFFESKYASNMWYIGGNSFTVAVLALRNFFTYFVLFNTMIPQSLWVTLELVKVGQARFMSWDDSMKYGNNKMQPKTSNLNEDLGRIQHIFSDKTGTLTENIMNFKKCSINGVIYSEESRAVTEQLERSSISEKERRHISLFMNVMTMCHTVVPEVNEKSGETSYNAQSPDEVALVECAKNNNFVFKGRIGDEVVVEELGKDVKYRLLATLDFTSARRRMSIIVQYPDGSIVLLCKGADMIIYDRLVNTESDLKRKTSEHLQLFSRDGLRTLVLAYKVLRKEELDDWVNIYRQAVTAIDNREEKVEAACEIIENDLCLLGCTAIEDKLQNEVPETIHYLREAGIQLWVLTGDKQETAINIGFSSRLLTPDMELIIINAENTDICGELLKMNVEKYCNKKFTEDEGFVAKEGKVEDEEQRTLGLVIDGHSLGFALHDHVEAFLTLGAVCKSVICCRATPLQKALVVRIVKHGEGTISCAIGDGANDVSMIQEAHVGVGIVGKEGTQAALASDYAIHQFSHLKRLLCVHGRYSYIRITGLIQYSFYKNMAFTLCMFYFSFFNGFTGQTLFDAWVITFYNIVFTSIPPIVYGLFERDLDDNHPQSYRRIQKGSLFTKLTFLMWLLSSVWHSLVTYFGVQFMFENDVIRAAGINSDIWTMGAFASTIVVIIVNLRIALETKTWNVLVHIAIWGSILAYFGLLIIYSNFSTLDLTSMYYVIIFMITTPTFWLILVLCTVIALLPDFAVKYFARQYKPEDWQILREKYLKLKDLSPIF